MYSFMSTSLKAGEGVGLCFVFLPLLFSLFFDFVSPFLSLQESLPISACHLRWVGTPVGLTFPTAPLPGSAKSHRRSVPHTNTFTLMTKVKTRARKYPGAAQHAPHSVF